MLGGAIFYVVERWGVAGLNGAFSTGVGRDASKEKMIRVFIFGIGFVLTCIYTAGGFGVCVWAGFAGVGARAAHAMSVAGRVKEIGCCGGGC